MTRQQVQEVLAAAEPGTRVRIWCVEFEAPASDAPHASPVDEIATPTSESVVPLAPRSRADNPVDRVRALAAAEPGLRLSAGEWKQRVPDLSERELDRAMRAGALAWERRGEGKGHAARVIPAENLITYLGLCEAVQEGRLEKPEWWDEVRKGRRAHVRAA
jgi:hypothetical protein